MISDTAVQQLFQQCFSTLKKNDIVGDNKPLQFYRGITSKNWENNPHPGSCQRHMAMFKTFNVIPEYCFACFKVLIVPRTVVELFKLMMVFESLKLADDNTRKCMIEVRPEISGVYKGYIFCQSLEDGKELLNIARTLVSEKISRDIPVSLKRGCSEYPLIYPEYANIEDNGKPFMNYREEWRNSEDFADKELKQIPPMTVDSHNHPGFDVSDTLAMCAWLSYAATIGDLSYLKIYNSAVSKMPIERPAFQAVEDN